MKEVINTLVFAIIQPSVSKADYLGLEISADGLRDVYAQIIDFYEMNKEMEERDALVPLL